jgi:NAD(P)-dependent dehydrogenase (short-subunit alcohol dehydrogenase family)
MNVDGKVAVVTGGGGGIGAALTRRLVDAGASVVVVDLDEAAAKVAAGTPTVGIGADAATSSGIAKALALAAERFGPVDLYCANAGIFGQPGLGDSDEEWARILDVNVSAHVRAARLLVPGWLARGGGYFASTASAAGLLTQVGAAPYAVTKHAAVGFAEWLSVTYGDRGIGVSCLCPMGVNTAMLDDRHAGARVVRHVGEVLEPDEVAACLLSAIADERFLALPHPEVLEFHRRKGRDYDRWLRGMRRLRREVVRA